MKKQYDLSKLKKRPGKAKVDPESAKVPISLRIDGSDLADLKTEADRLGVPYQTLIGSVLHRFIIGDLVDSKLIMKSLESFKKAI
jgi:predicted DNA binding CopG/RHH family protein